MPSCSSWLHCSTVPCSGLTVRADSEILPGGTALYESHRHGVYVACGKLGDSPIANSCAAGVVELRRRGSHLPGFFHLVLSSTCLIFHAI